DRAGGEGWVRAEACPAIEADGFAGASNESVIDGDRLRADFAAYRPELGNLGHELVRLHHSATTHAEELVGLLGDGEPPARDDAFETLARLVRLEARASIRIDAPEAENRRMGEGLGALVGERDAARAQLNLIMRSRSWRLAEPFRRIAALLRRRRR